jgi:hypothetical protein
MHQTRERLFKGNTHVPGRLVSLFEPHTEVIRKGKASKRTEFGKMVKVQEAEAQIVTYYEVYGKRAWDSDLLLPALDVHRQLSGRMSYLVTADVAFFTPTPKVCSVSGSRRNAGSATLSSGAPAARAASVFSNAATAWTAVATRGCLASSAGWAWRHRRQPDQHRPRARPLGRAPTSTLPLPLYLPGRKAAADARALAAFPRKYRKVILAPDK